MALLTFPIIDIAPYGTGAKARKRESAQHVGAACRELGFLITLNLSHVVARHIWRRRGGCPLRCRAHRLHRRRPL